MNLYHYYHVYAVNGWEDIVDEHIEAVISSGLSDQLERLSVGVVGDPGVWNEVYKRIGERLPNKTYFLAAAEFGWEQVTINAMRHQAMMLRDGLALYAHTKGVAFPGEHPDRWRQVMTDECINNWRAVVDDMELFSYDTAGCYFIEEQLYEQHVPVFTGVHGVSMIAHMLQKDIGFEYDGEIDEPVAVLKRVHYSGNFWWSTLDWLRKLSYPCPSDTRWDAEFYVGKAADGSLPLALNLRQGSPFNELRTEMES